MQFIRPVFSFIMRYLAISILSVIYGITIAFQLLKSGTGTKKAGSDRYIVVIGVFHNPNWFRSHILPLSKADIGKIILVTDSSLEETDNLTYFIPPKALSRILSRAGAKFIWSIYAGFKYRPAMFMGYHIFPAAVIASICGRLFNTYTCYQITSGKLEIEGGGYNAENRLLVALGKHSRVIESLTLRVISGFDLLIVRGSEAETYLREKGINNRISIITGSTNIKKPNTISELKKDIDLIFVGRMIEGKRPALFINAVHIVTQTHPDLKAVMVGDGPELTSISNMISSNNLQDNIQMLGQISNVEEWLLRSKVFILTSKWEGVSISMLEAMACATVPIVSNVGDLKDVVTSGSNGYLIEKQDANEFASAANELLDNNSLRDQLAENALETATKVSDIESVSARWHDIVCDIIQ